MNPPGGLAGAGESPHRLLRASAGSGKTHQLALRYLRALFSGDRPEGIVATTFTREAAREIVARIFVWLSAAVLNEEAARSLGRQLGHPELSRALCGEALNRLVGALGTLSVSTLDSLYYRMTCSLRAELRLPSVPMVVALEEPLVASMREEALAAALGEMAEADWMELIGLFDRLQGQASRRSVARSLDGLLLDLYQGFLEAPEEHLWGRLVVPEAAGEEALQEAVDELEQLLATSGPGVLRKALSDNVESLRASDWRGLLGRGLAAKVAAGEARFRNKAIPPRWLEVLSVVQQHGRSELVREAQERSRATWKLLEVFDRHYAASKRRAGVVLFSDLARGLARWLQDGDVQAVEDLYYRLDGRITHLLVDEFQDTSLEQWAVLRPIAHEIRSYGDGSRTVFCVGDPKQAIYGWRGGCADLFEELEEDLQLDAAVAVLDTSYRSSPVVLDVVNIVFGKLASMAAMSEHRGTVELWARSFARHASAWPERAGYAELRESGSTEDHLIEVTTGIAELVHEMPDASIAVLVSTNGQAAEILDRLRASGVRASGVGGSAVVDDGAVGLVVSALVLADHPGDSVAAFHVLHSPLAEVLALESLAPDAVRKTARRIRDEWSRLGPGELVGRWIGRLRSEYGARSGLRLDQLLGLVGRFENSRLRRPGELARYVEAARVEAPRGPGVRVMTIHRSKGLEFDLVVMPELDRRLLSLASPLYVERRSPLAAVEAVHRGASEWVRDSSPEILAAWETDRARRLRDDLSALYVALTRARFGLYLWCRPVVPSRDEALSYASLLRGVLADLGQGARDVLWQAGEPEEVVGVLRSPAEPSRAPSRGLPASGAGNVGPEAVQVPTMVDLDEEMLQHGATGKDLFAIREEGVAGGLGPFADTESRWLEGRERARAWLGADLGDLQEMRDCRFVVAEGGTTFSGVFERVWRVGQKAEGSAVAVAGEGASAPAVARALRAGVVRRLGIAASNVALLVPSEKEGWRLLAP